MFYEKVLVIKILILCGVFMVSFIVGPYGNYSHLFKSRHKDIDYKMPE